MFNFRLNKPDNEYLYLLGLCTFSFSGLSAYVVEYILDCKNGDQTTDWWKLIDMQAGVLKKVILKDDKYNAKQIYSIFEELVEKRNRIIHGFPITSKFNEQILATKDRKHKQYYIDKFYMIEFLKKVEYTYGLINKQLMIARSK